MNKSNTHNNSIIRFKNGRAYESHTKGQAQHTAIEDNQPNLFVAAWRDIKAVFSMFGSRLDGSYKTTPWSSIMAICAAMIYLMFPFDIITDILPVVGWIDDLTVFKICLDFCKKDLEAYRRWLDEKENIIDMQDFD